MIIEVPAVEKPVTARSSTHQTGSMTMPVDQRDDGDDGDEAGKGADMADAAHHFRRDQAADDETAAQDVPSRPSVVVA